MGVESDQAGQPVSSAAEDAILVDRVRAGDLSAFDELVRRHHGRIYGLVYHMTGHRQDAEDLVQSIFMKAYRSLDRFRGQSAFYTWLYRVAVNATINFRQRSRRRQGLSLDDLDRNVEADPEYVALAARCSPVRDASLGELQGRLNAALQTLSEKHRTVVVLHDVQGMPHEEIARLMECSVGTVRSRLFYARRLLQNELAEFAP
jgi:RNA polymerase sigma-70 factor (ECF subfamily)